MRKYILYSHAGSGNHGCEALVRSTIDVLNVEHKNTVLLSTRPEEDLFYGIDSLCRIMNRYEVKQPSRLGLLFWKAYWKLKTKRDYTYMDNLANVTAVGASSGDIAFSIGGDVYCYGSTAQLAREHQKWKSSKLKTVYWGVLHRA